MAGAVANQRVASADELAVKRQRLTDTLTRLGYDVDQIQAAFAALDSTWESIRTVFVPMAERLTEYMQLRRARLQRMHRAYRRRHR